MEDVACLKTSMLQQKITKNKLTHMIMEYYFKDEDTLF